VSRNRLWQSLWIAGTAALVAVAPVRADTSAITDVRVETSADGLQLILEFDGEETPQIFSSASGNTLIVDILNTRLRLADGDRFSADNPNEAIAEIAVSPLDENNVRLIVTSQSGQPAIEWNEAGGALIFQVTTAEVETPTLPNLSADPSAEGDARPDDIIEILVTATRNLERLTDVPRSTSVIEQEQIEEQMRVTRDLGTILSQEVPGLSPPTQSASNFGQTLRGRNISVLIDGIPQSTNRNVARDLRTIDPGAISNESKSCAVRPPFTATAPREELLISLPNRGAAKGLPLKVGSISTHFRVILATVSPRQFNSPFPEDWARLILL
jgi:iron complex outermembrane receptor protein